MDYKEKYEQALARAKKLATNLPNGRNDRLYYVDDLEHIFPELKESEDERIRKELLDFCKNRAENYPNDPKYKNISAWIAWLEKQGEQAKIEALRTEYEKGRADAIAELKQKPFDYSNANIQQKDFAMPLHSQRKSLQQVLNDFKNDFDYFVRYAENYIAEQKLTEWNEDDEKIRKEIMDFIDINTIVSDERHNRWFSYLEKQGKQKPAEEYNITGIGSKNAEGKLGEMIKNLKHDNEVLEQKPTDKYEGLTDFERTLADICVGWIGEELGWKQYIKDNADVLLKIAIKKFNSVQDVAFEQNPAWSEEDKAMVEDIIEAIDTQYAVTDYNEMVNWLKSLKDRIQPKVELTQLDKNILEAAIAFVEQNNHFNCWRGVDKHTVLSALHSLKPQNTWKPSDLQIEALDSATENCAYSEY